MHNPKFFFAHIVLGAVCLSVTTACNSRAPVSGSGSGPATADPPASTGNPVDRPAGDDTENGGALDCARAFPTFDEIGPWFLSTPDPFLSAGASVMIDGLNDQVENVEIALGAPDFTSCSLHGSEVTAEISGNSIHLASANSDDANAGLCSLDLTAVVNPCGMSVYLGMATLDVFELDGTGRVTVDGMDGSLGPMQLLGMLPPQGAVCEEWPDSLAGMDWEFSIQDPLMPYSPEPDETLYVNLSGADDLIEYASAYRYVEYEPVAEPGDEPARMDCYDDFPAGSVTFDGRNVTVRAELTAAGYDTADACSLSYTGTILDCEMFGPFAGGFDGGPMQILRSDGTGSVSAGDFEAAFNSLYLSITPRPVPGVDLCNDPFAELAEDEYWRVASRNPFSRGPYEPTGLEMAGSGDRVYYYQGLPLGDDVNRGEPCFGVSPEGSFSIDGETLAFELSSAEAGARCSAVFHGTLAACETKIDDAVFFSNTEVRLLQFDGTGEITMNDETSPLSTVYFVRDRGDYGDGSAVPPPREPPAVPVP